MSQTLRPALPKLLIPLCFTWLGVLSASELIYQGFSYFWELPGILTVCVGVLLVWRYRSTRRLSVPLLSLFTFCLALSVAYSFYSERVIQVEESTYYRGRQQLIIIKDTSTYASSRGSEALLLGEGKEFRVRVFWNDLDLALAKGTHISAYCNVKSLQEDERWLFNNGIVATVSISDIEESSFSQDAWGAIDSFRSANVDRIGKVGGEGAALLAGVLLGYREALQDTTVEQDFITCGLTHLIAVSGSHLAVVAALFGWLLRKLPLGRTSEVALLLLVLLFYVMLTGLQPSAIRSAIMAGVAGCSVFIGRRGHAPSALTAAALIMLVVYPPNAYSIGFWLSVFAVMGITLFANLLASWLARGLSPKRTESPGMLSSATSVTLAATAATMPIAVPTFAVLSIVGPLANILVAPLISLVLILGMLALLLAPFIEPLGDILLAFAVVISEVSCWIAAGLSRIPFASIPLYFPLVFAVLLTVSLAAVIYWRWPLPNTKTVRVVAGTLVGIGVVCVLLTPILTPARLVLMDVGQGDAILVQEQNKTILIDTGASEQALTHALARNRVTHLDAIVITHLDSDHAGALARMRGLVQVDAVYFAEGLLHHQEEDTFIRTAASVTSAENVKELSVGAQLQLGRTLSLLMVWPQVEAKEGSNKESICLLLQYDANADGKAEQQALLTGDAESNELNALLCAYPNLTADILKVGHHGSKSAVTQELVQDLGSTVALISAGLHNSYGHPAVETLEVLEAAGVHIARTDQCGDITLSFNGSRLELRYATMNAEL